MGVVAYPFLKRKDNSMRSAQEIYDNTPFEDENGLIPHDKLAVKVAEEYAGQFQPKWIEVKYDLPDVGHTFKKGHRIMIQVQSTAFPLFARNPQKFVENPYKADQSDYIKATHTVYNDSFIDVEVLK